MLNISIFQNPDLYIAITSIIALLLSLIPYFQKFKKTKLELDVHNRIWITHTVGNPLIQLSLIIKNIGAKNISINNIHIQVSRDKESLIKLPLQNYMEKPADQTSILFRKFTLTPNEEWNHNSNFMNFLKRDDLMIFKDTERKLKTEIERKRAQKTENKSHSAVEADESFVEPFKVLFDKHFKWKEGNYTFTINIKTDENIADISKSFSFTIFKSLESEFINDKSRYLTGDRIYWYSDNYYGEWVEIE